MRIMIAGTGSGCGKTTVSCAILAALKRRDQSVVSFKCGPDYIDTAFHRRATGIDSFNLDAWLMGERGVLESLSFNARNRDVAVIEGVMGLYDGIGRTDEASANALSLLTDTPVVLVVDAKGKSLSVCAEIQGYKNFKRNRIAAVLLNRTKPATYPFYKELIETRAGIPVAGFMPDMPEAVFSSRHLGLVAPDEIADTEKKIGLLGETAAETVDLELLFEIASKAGPVETPQETHALRRGGKPARIYVADDRAFRFYYPDNHRILEECGAELRFFSPIDDARIPGDADGLIFWGGYPELYAAELAANESLKQSIRDGHAGGMPIYAECGGFMYMNERIVDPGGSPHPMTGIVEGTVSMTDSLQRFGYVALTANRDNILCGKGGRINAHSFHYSRSTNEGGDFTAEKAGAARRWPCIVASEKLFTGYPHLHFAGNRRFAAAFVDACRRYGERKKR